MTEIPQGRTKAESFPIKNVLEKSSVETSKFTTPIQVLLNDSRACRGTKKKTRARK